MIFRKREEEDYSLSMTPLIDVVFLLLIFFMVSTQLLDFSRRMDIQLPETKAGVADEKMMVFVLEITKERRIYLNGDEIREEEIGPRVREANSLQPRKSAVIRADRSLPYGEVVEIMGMFQEVGIKDIGIVVK